MRFAETVTVHRYTRDRKGNRTLLGSWLVSGVGRAAVGGWSGQGTASEEERNTLGETVRVAETLYGPFDWDVVARDVVEFSDGELWEVDGEPARWRSPLTGWPAGTVVNVERVEG